jgi:hypothetical protein
VKSPRGRATFVDGASANYSARSVIELTFCDVAKLPASTMVSRLGSQQWKSLLEFDR